MERLPEELCVRIFSRLDHQTLAAALQVCRKWKVLASDDALWSNLFRERWGEEVSWKRAYKAQDRCDQLTALEGRVASLETQVARHQERYELLMSTLFLNLGIPFPDAP